MAPPKSKGDEKILSYLDVVMRRSDLDILRRPHYLNDRIIEFYSAHLAYLSPSPRALHLLLAHQLPRSPIPPPVRLPDRDLVLFPVNSNLDVTGASSSTAGRPASSCTTTAAAGCHAEQLFHGVSGFVGDGGEPPRFTPQTTNGHDCGLFVMAIAKVVYDWYVARGGCADGEDRLFAALKEKSMLMRWIS